MRKIYLIFALIIGICFTSLGQNLNSYKYVVVPEKFDFLKEANQYQMNELTKFLFEKYDFKAVMTNEERPADFSMQPCNALFADVIQESGFLQTKLKVVLKDCRNLVVFTSEEGKSKEKDFKKAYQESLRDAFKAVAALSYQYEKNHLNFVVINETETPKNTKNLVTPEKERGEVLVSAIPKKQQNTAENLNLTTGEKSYFSGDLEVYLLSTDFGFQIFQKEMEEPFAKLVKTKNSGYFIYSTFQNNGIAYFDENENLNIEIISKDGNSTSLKTYQVRD